MACDIATIIYQMAKMDAEAALASNTYLLEMNMFVSDGDDWWDLQEGRKLHIAFQSSAKAMVTDTSMRNVKPFEVTSAMLPKIVEMVALSVHTSVREETGTQPDHAVLRLLKRYADGTDYYTLFVLTVPGEVSKIIEAACCLCEIMQMQPCLSNEVKQSSK